MLTILTMSYVFVTTVFPPTFFVVLEVIREVLAPNDEKLQ